MTPLDARGLPPGYPFRPDDEVAPRAFAAGGSDAHGASGTMASRPLLLDVRTPAEREICRIEPSVSVPLHQLEASIDDLKARVGDDLDARIVVYCHHGRRSLAATYVLRAAGFTDVRSLAGGIHLWALDVDRAMPTY